MKTGAGCYPLSAQMFRLLVNIGGVFDVYVSKKAPGSLRTAVLPTLTTTGPVGSIFVERLRFGERIDYGRNRYLLLLTTAAMTELERRHLVGSLEEAVGAEFDRLIEAVNRDEIAEDLRRIYAACAGLDEQDDAWVDLSKSPQYGEASKAAVTSPSAGAADTDRAELPREPRAQDDSRDRQGPEDTTVKIGGGNGRGRWPWRPVSLGTVVAINLVFAGMVFGSMAWYLDRNIGRVASAGGLDVLLGKVADLSTKLAAVQSSVNKLDQTVKAALAKVAEPSPKLENVEGTVERGGANAVDLPVKGSGKDRNGVHGPPEPGEDKVDEQTCTERQVEGLHKEKSEWKYTKEEVKQVQRILQEHGHYQDKIDGDKGRKTTKAIAKWQEEKGKCPTGALDRQTFNEIVGNEPSSASNAEDRQGDAEP